MVQNYFKFLVILILAPSGFVFAETQVECGSKLSPVAYNYCITKTVGSPSRDVVYYMHAAQGNEHQWQHSHASIEKAWAAAGVEAPTIVTISFGKIWLLIEKNSLPASGLLEAMTQSIFPEMEALAVPKGIGRRLLFGLSMGGFNSTELLLKKPHLFSRAVIACPALMDLSPWASEEQKMQFEASTGAEKATVESISIIVKTYVPDEAYWLSKVSPYTLAPQVLDAKTPSVMIASNESDFTFYDGGKKFAELATSLGAPVTWRSWAGGHCNLDQQVIADFLIKK